MKSSDQNCEIYKKNRLNTSVIKGATIKGMNMLPIFFLLKVAPVRIRLALDVTKPVFGNSDNARLKSVSSATETS